MQCGLHEAGLTTGASGRGCSGGVSNTWAARLRERRPAAQQVLRGAAASPPSELGAAEAAGGVAEWAGAGTRHRLRGSRHRAAARQQLLRTYGYSPLYTYHSTTDTKASVPGPGNSQRALKHLQLRSVLT